MYTARSINTVECIFTCCACEVLYDISMYMHTHVSERIRTSTRASTSSRAHTRASAITNHILIISIVQVAMESSLKTKCKFKRK